MLLGYQNSRNVRWYLAALKELGHIRCVQFNRSYYYFLAQSGADILNSIDPSIPKSLDRTPAGMMVLAAHNSAVTETMMSFIDHDNAPKNGLLLWRGPTECEGLYPYTDGQPKIIPDALGYYVHEGGESSFNLELDSGKQAQKIIDEKIRHYYTYFHLHGYDPSQQIIMFVTLMNPTRVQNIINTANSYLRNVDKKMRVIVTTMKELENQGPYADIWQCNLTNGKKKHSLQEMAIFAARDFQENLFLGHEEILDGRRDLLRSIRSDMEVINGLLVL